MKKFTHSLIIILSIFVLSACQSKWSPEVDLTPEERSAIEAEIVEIQSSIDEQISESEKADINTYIRMARKYEDLGSLKKSEAIYKQLIEEKRVSSTIHNNLAQLYETVEDYEKAIEQYTILTDTLFESQYLKNITWVYIKTGERKLAEKYFNAWQQAFRTTDVIIQDAIKELRAAEKAAKE
ncbi:tetratricopeptide repeat protein [Candidatus Pacearchaeota archaeon]|nr:tetratricopeptide repeat protein [Candidatus Pacearchaeota archaeon]